MIQTLARRFKEHLKSLRRPHELSDLQRLLSDADLRSQIKNLTYGELENKFSFWL